MMSNIDTCRRLPSGLFQTRTGLIIGGAAKHRPPAMTDDAIRIQSALLDKRTAQKPTVLQRIFGAVWRWL
jgi:hypothetical protein